MLQPIPVISQSEEEVRMDVERVGRIPILASMLEIICSTTGMGFAVIAKVTKERWIACGVRDEIQFGLQPGGELKVETTICNEIRDSGTAVIIDHVAADPRFSHHHTPQMYGFQSYISIPIFCRSGEFFGTLCAIDPKPALLNNPRTIGMFNLFAELISFHLAILTDKEQAEQGLKKAGFQLRNYKEEVRQYQRLSNHNLQEPLRKIRVFSDLLITSPAHLGRVKIVETAQKINLFARDLSEMLRDLTDFSGYDCLEKSLEPTDLLREFLAVTDHLKTRLQQKNAIVHADLRHSVEAVPGQVAALFHHLLDNALRYAQKDTVPDIRVYSRELDPGQTDEHAFLMAGRHYCELVFEDNSTGIEPPRLERIFDIYSRTSETGDKEGLDINLALCRKIVYNHGGAITARSGPGKGITFFIILPRALRAVPKES